MFNVLRNFARKEAIADSNLKLTTNFLKACFYYEMHDFKKQQKRY